MTEELRFYVEEDGRPVGPRLDDELREALRAGTLSPATRVRSVGAPLWLPARAWAALAVRTSDLPPPPGAGAAEAARVSPDLLSAPADVLDMVCFHLAENGRVASPQPGAQLRAAFEGGKHRAALVAPAGTEDWVAARRLFDRTLSEARSEPAISAPDLRTVRCPTCLEIVSETSEVCPECDEPLAAQSAAPSTARPGSVPDDPEGASWLTMHWRPLITFGAIFGLIFVGIGLRILAPGRFLQSSRVEPMTAAAPTCEAACWAGEACQLGACVWQAPQGAGRVGARPAVTGPFELGADATDAIVLDDERFAVGSLAGVQVRSLRTGRALGLVSEAPQTRRLVRVGDVMYAAGPQHVAVIDAASTRLEKTIELGAIVGDITLGAGGRRALVSLPGAHAIAILSTELHAEIDRIRFGDDPVGPMGVDETGKRALATTGLVPVAGLPDPAGGAIYAFDPSRLATAQDRVRASMLGNPVDVLMAPDGRTSFVVLRAKNQVVPLAWEASGAVRPLDPIATCDQPEHAELVRKGRRGAVRCHRGRGVELLDLEKRELARHLPFNAPVADMAVSPDGDQLVVALPGPNGGAVGLVDLSTYDVELVPLTAPPTRVRLAPDGRSVLVLSDRNKVAWVLR